jgi:plasmid stabilization system protein ParE
VNIRWSKDALAHLRDIQDWLAEIEGASSKRVTLDIKASVNKLKILGDIGRPSLIATARELSVRGQPYVVVYRVEEDFFKIVAVFHTSQDR